jgi:hypothetical protein
MRALQSLGQIVKDIAPLQRPAPERLVVPERETDVAIWREINADLQSARDFSARSS